MSYGKRTAVDAFTDRIESGEWVGLIGPNGAGKSSLLRAAAGLVASTGTISVDGAALASMADRERGAVVSRTSPRSR